MSISPVPDLLRTNSIPSPAQIELINAFISLSEPELGTLETEFIRIQTSLAAAKTRLEKQKQLVEDHRVLLSPMRRVPDDVLRAIFLATLPAHRDTAIVPEEGPLLLAQVCRLWRDIALTTPRLWASIHLAIPRDESRAEDLVGILTTWLQRSAAAPLSLTVTLAHASMSPPHLGPGWRHTTHGDELLRVLSSEAHRWESLRLLDKIDLSKVPFISSLTAESVPKLRHISFSEGNRTWSHVGDVEASTSNPLLLLGTESLLTLSLDGYTHLLPPFIPWAKLRHVSLDTPYTYGIASSVTFPLAILEMCSALEAFAFSSGHAETVILPPIPTTLSFPRLIALAIESFTPANWTDLLQRAHFPRLHALGVLGLANDLTWLEPRAITALHLTENTLKTDDLVKALAALPTLEELSIGGEPYDANQNQESDADFIGPKRDAKFLHQFMLPIPLCPRLQRFRLYVISACSDHTLVDFLRYRCNPTDSSMTALVCADFTIVRSNMYSKDFSAQLAAEVANGLRLSVTLIQRNMPTPQYNPKSGLHNERPETGFVFERNGTAIHI
ncbi:F-box domain-containing protein [Mycena indigotica]|uniref:F-box domain-containing protein n=1 Tax=Mycena indigotica TaxID=2126181 RepID=A0A8H6SL20_9AGAR|nr:F-box domain-containing protein [Mycena indigotica]KAF7300953.1 F-box domain-containing protein [Mycena indigotica]